MEELETVKPCKEEYASFGFIWAQELEFILRTRENLLLCGGDKGSQERDIEKAKSY